MTRVTLYILFSLFSLTAFSQKVYFVYLQTEDNQPFYVRMDKAMYSSTASGYVIVSKLKDSTYSFIVGFPQNKWPEQKFSVALNKKDHGYLVKNFGEKGWGLYDLQTMSLQMAGSDNAKTSTGGKDESPFTDILAKASDDPSLKELPPITVNEKGTGTAVPEKKTEAVVETNKPDADTKITEPVTVKTEDKKAIVKNKPVEKKKPVTVPAVAKTEVKKSDEKDKPVAKVEDKTEPEVVKTEPVVLKTEEPVKAEPVVLKTEEPVVAKTEDRVVTTYKPSVVVKKSENATKDGVGLVFIDQTSDGNADTIALIIPDTKPLVPVQENPVKEEKKFVEILPDATEDNLIVKPGQKFYHEMNNCATLAKDNDFFKLRKQMASVDGDDKMLAEAKTVFKDKCFTTQQVKNLGALFLTDAGKLNFFVAGYYHVSDKNNYNTLQSELREETYISQFKAMLTQ